MSNNLVMNVHYGLGSKDFDTEPITDYQVWDRNAIYVRGNRGDMEKLYMVGEMVGSRRGARDNGDMEKSRIN